MKITLYVRWTSDDDKAPSEAVVNLMEAMLAEKASARKLGAPMPPDRTYWEQTKAWNNKGIYEDVWVFAIYRDYEPWGVKVK